MKVSAPAVMVLAILILVVQLPVSASELPERFLGVGVHETRQE
jgi:hypothetical protein